ncbi:MAG TPA: hypothetical protein PKA21_09010 [Kiritimatiellia bacterium]|nr:hypothetical protein [Kiritimatiellia bacterium]HMP35007.1 hypothetical protein [Kiritimatiellia bacterium]
MPDPVITEEQRDIIRDDKGRWVPGGAPPACRPKGTLGGRALALRTLDSIMAKERNQVYLANALQEHFYADPVRFFKTIIMPLLPQDVKVRLSEEGGFSWLSLPDMIRMKASNASTSPVIDVSESSVADAGGERRSALPPKS